MKFKLAGYFGPQKKITDRAQIGTDNYKFNWLLVLLHHYHIEQNILTSLTKNEEVRRAICGVVLSSAVGSNPAILLKFVQKHELYIEQCLQGMS